MALPQWNTAAFGCLLREGWSIQSLMRTQVSAQTPAPFVSRTADMSAPLALAFEITLDHDAMRAWEQWYTYDLNDGSLPFLMFLPWGDTEVQARCRLLGQWVAQRINSVRWSIGGTMEIERESLPIWSGGVA